MICIKHINNFSLFNKFSLLSLQLVDEVGRVKGWVDSSEPGTGNWMKYVRSASDPNQQNLMAVQVHDQVRENMWQILHKLYFYAFFAD